MRRLLVWSVTLVVLGLVVWVMSTPHSQRPCLVTKPGACGTAQRQGAR